MRSEMKKDDRWNDDYFKRLGATSVLDFVRFNAMVAFDNGMNGHSSGMSRREFALLISESGRDVVSELLKKKKNKEMEGGDDESSHKNKKKMEGGDDESSNKNKKSKKKKKKKMEGGESESSNKNQLSETDMKKMMIEQAGGYRFRLDPTNPEVQAKMAEMRKESERRASLREKRRQAAAKALSEESSHKNKKKMEGGDDESSNKNKKSKKKKDDRWNDDYFKRLGATTVLDFVRFNAMVAFDNGMNGHSSGMSRREFALLISESGRDVVSELLKKKKNKEMEGGDDESSHKNKKKMEGGDDESSNKNKKSKKKKKKKMEGGESESSNKNQLSETDMKKMMIEQAGGYRFRLDPTNPEVQAKMAEMRKESERRASLREKRRQAAAKALSDESRRDALLVN